eukprot:CAMPEP_0206451140 /NCGR_PEP_ID=MMETSP0324_2-20121206/19150_1 /ASSEMBLY_ACC=CAM_ASM_000836 /TAXON_ID=2866 /ORGANISM="Crypthecodinium cohnii, Strain Seligo" /LENGTH=581 /DNA_ID=CAMNT_0053920937 /DNA_START=132 /DNA_END=1874 /DNA_ORIENTATION=+
MASSSEGRPHCLTEDEVVVTPHEDFDGLFIVADHFALPPASSEGRATEAAPHVSEKKDVQTAESDRFSGRGDQGSPAQTAAISGAATAAAAAAAAIAGCEGAEAEPSLHSCSTSSSSSSMRPPRSTDAKALLAEVHGASDRAMGHIEEVALRQMQNTKNIFKRASRHFGQLGPRKLAPGIFDQADLPGTSSSGISPRPAEDPNRVSGDVDGPAQTHREKEDLSIHLLEDEDMHQRWADLLKGRAASDVPEAELHFLVETGTPLRYRHHLWPRWWSSKSTPELRESMEVWQQRSRATCTRQIECDLARTMPEYLGGEEQSSLRRILRACAGRHPEVGYCQGESFLAAVPLLLGFGEEAVLACLCYILEDICPGYHGPCLEGFFRDVNILSVLVSYLLPEVHVLLDELNMPLHILATDHLLTLSARTWPFLAVARLWDVVLMDGSPALLASFLALLNMYFKEAVSLARQEDRGNTLQPADVATHFRDIMCLNIARDIDELVQQTRRRFLPLVRGEPSKEGPRGSGNFLTWFRLQSESELELSEQQQSQQEQGTPKPNSPPAAAAAAAAATTATTSSSNPAESE